MKIITNYWSKPIPPRQFDWTATYDGYEPGDPIGHGRTEQEAIKDLQAAREAPFFECPDCGKDLADYEMPHSSECESRRSRCLCGYPDWPGRCPGPANCPIHNEEPQGASAGN